ncbi:alpha/beta hydrolase [Vogesella facilis]|uniref:Alpha/beta hydrolase n=1 Tax=Vogesella facilis TaxID=1655232 RepID=A0ABV7RD58_9NEIS
MWDDDDVFLVTVPGWGDSGPQHWQSHWERLYPLSRRVEQDDWLYPTRSEWVARLAATVDDCAGKVVLAAHSLGCHTVVAWLAQASLPQQSKVQGVLLVAPPALPITPARALASGELPAGAAVPDFAGFEAPLALRLPLPARLVASRDDLFCSWAEAEALAQGWGVPLLDAGNAGHMGSHSGLGDWQAGQRLLQQLMLG